MKLIYDIIKVEISKILYFALVDRLSCMRLFAMQTSYTTCMARRLRVMSSPLLCIPSASHVLGFAMTRAAGVGFALPLHTVALPCFTGA